MQMSDLTEKLRIFERIANGDYVHIAAIGSSSTEHFMVGAHWFDYVNIGFMHKYRRWVDDGKSVINPQLCLNAGVSNHTTRELLARYDRDIAPFKPDLLIFLSGQNDANPERNISREEFRANLVELRRRTEDLGGDMLFQTYFDCDREKFAEKNPEWSANYEDYAQIIREVAGDLLVDHFNRWQLLRKYDLKAFRLLMRDANHLNPIGNAVIGLDLVRALDLVLPDENLPWISAGVFARDCMDLLEKMDAEK